VTAFERAINFTLKWEGYKSGEDSWDDPGGRTIFGLSSRSHRGIVDAIWDLPKDEAEEKAKEVYKEIYWDATGCDQLDEVLGIVVFDTAVNLGIQRALNILKMTQNWKDYIFFRINYYCGLKELFPKFGRGWVNRAVDLWNLLR